jgi:chaperone required for assembly of F1-ATPase
LGRRFYAIADVRDGEDGYALVLDGLVPRTPGGHAVSVPTRALAEVLADEWRAQGDQMLPDTMPVTQLVNTALDRVQSRREAIVEQIAAFGASDLLCYRAEMPADLVERQHAVWQPLLTWAAETLDAPLRVTRGVIPLSQPESSLAALQATLASLGVWSLTAVQGVVPALGSLILGMALLRGRLSADQAVAASLLDEGHQAERWGMTEETRLRHAILQRDVTAATHLIGID